MSTRAERQVEILAQQTALQHSIRAVEAVHGVLHDELLNWGRWGRDKAPGCPPEYATLKHMILLGDDIREGDPEPTEKVVVPEPDVNELAAERLDVKIHRPEFVALWRRILLVNYVWRPIEWDRPMLVFRRAPHMPDHQYLDQLHLAMEALER